MRVVSDIYRVDGVTCNVYLLDAPEGVTIVDSGMPGAARRILAAVEALGRAPRDVRHLIITHQHVDHIGALAELARATGAETWAGAGDTPAIEGRARREAPHGALGLIFRLVFFSRLAPASVAHVVREGDTLPIFGAEGGLRVIETPGHTAGHVSIYLPARRLLFAGDAVRASKGGLALSPRMLNLDTSQALQSVRKLASMEIESCLPGHGAPVIVGARALLTAAAGEPVVNRV